jgi:hypothetical protein
MNQQAKRPVIMGLKVYGCFLVVKDRKFSFLGESLKQLEGMVDRTIGRDR